MYLVEAWSREAWSVASVGISDGQCTHMNEPKATLPGYFTHVVVVMNLLGLVTFDHLPFPVISIVLSHISILPLE